MAYIREHRGKWRAEVEKLGVRRSAVWDTKAQAQDWAKKVEAEIKAGAISTNKTFSEAVDRYMETVSPTKRGARWEEMRGPKMKGHFDKPLKQITPADVAAWRDARLALVSPSTVVRESHLLRSIFDVAVKEWGWLEKNPMATVRMPKHEPPRHQIWGWREIRRVVRYLGYTTGKAPQTKSEETALAFLISLRTAMRAGEVLQVGPATVSGRVVTLVDTKTEKRAQVPLTKQGHRLCSQCQGFTVSSGTLDALFRRARDATLVGDLRFHDARATALTHMARKMDVMTLARISRHKDLKILFGTYYRESADQIAARL